MIRIIGSEWFDDDWLPSLTPPPQMSLVKDTWHEGIMARAIIKHIQWLTTSLDVGGQGHKLAEPLLLKEIPQGVGLGGTDIYIPDDQSVPPRVEEVPEMVGSTREWFILGPIDRYSISRAPWSRFWSSGCWHLWTCGLQVFSALLW